MEVDVVVEEDQGTMEEVVVVVDAGLDQEQWDIVGLVGGHIMMDPIVAPLLKDMDPQQP